MGKETWINSAKGIGIICVVLVHSGLPDIFVNLICTFAMPLFFVLSGYLFHFEKYKRDPLTFVKKKFIRLMIPFFIILPFLYGIWVIIKRVVIAYNIPYNNEIFALTPVDILLALMYGNGTETGPTISHLPTILDYPVNLIDIPLWFLPALFCLTLLLFILCYCHERWGNIKTLIISAILIVTGFFCGMYLYLPWGLDIAFVCLMFAGTGYIFQRYRIDPTLQGRKIPAILVFLCMIICWIINDPVDINNRLYGNWILLYLGGITGSLFIFWASHQFESYPRISDVWSKFGEMSLFILIFQIPMVEIPFGPLKVFFPEIDSFIYNYWFCWFAFSLVMCLFAWKISGLVPPVRRIFTG